MNHKHAVTQMGTDSFTYDANGNQVTRSVGGSSYTLTYDAENRLVGVSGAITASFVYDGDGNRVKGTISGTTTTYVGNYYEWTGSTTTMKKYYYAGTTRVAERTGSSTLNYLLGDHLGSQSITTSSSGAKTGEIRYYPWGTERYTWGTTPTTYHFTGQRLESVLGLYFYNARWYDPAAGRFLSPDTLIPEQSQGVQAWDRYAYTNNSPIIYFDPSGRTITIPCIFCNRTWGDYSSTQGLENKVIDIVSTVGCFLLGCHVDTKNDMISGPTEGEFLETSVMSIAPAPLTVVTSTGTARILGEVGEQTAGVLKNTTRIDSLTGTANFRIPDQLIPEQNLISEVKNVAYQSLTNQLKDFTLYAQKMSYSFELFVRENTRLSQPLKDAIETGKIILNNTLAK